MKSKIQLFLMCFCFSHVPAILHAQESNQLANNLIQLRGEVEDLQSELEILKSEHKTSMAYLNTRKTELTANIDRKKLQISQSQLEFEKLQEKIKLLGTGSEQLIPNVIGLIASIKQVLSYGIPFKQVERMSVVEDIERSVVARKITAQNGINRLWAFLEDEIRLSKENAIYSQTIELNGESQLVDIAKIGTVMLYFKTKQEKYGYAKKINNQWTYALLDNPQHSQLVAILFDSLGKQIRQGYFQLPLHVSTGELK